MSSTLPPFSQEDAVFATWVASVPDESSAAMKQHKLNRAGILRSYPRSAVYSSLGSSVVSLSACFSSVTSDDRTGIHTLIPTSVPVVKSAEDRDGLMSIAQGGPGGDDGLTGPAGENAETLGITRFEKSLSVDEGRVSVRSEGFIHEKSSKS